MADIRTTKLQKVFIYLRYNWGKLLLISILIAFIGLIITLLTFGVSNFASLESFSRKQMMAQMGMYLVMGIVQAFVFVCFIQLGQYFMMNGSLFSRMGQEKISLANSSIKWSDVIGMDTAKKEAWELVKLLKDDSLIEKIGGKIVKGTLMIGAPGCGKTYLAKAIASECGLPMLSAVGSEFVGMFVGQGASQMKSLFKQARKTAGMYGGCLIFIDEIDAFARPRMADTGFGGGISHNATINQFLTELDGLHKKENNIVIIAATNFPPEDLDSAIVRSGRFDRKIYITRPNLKERIMLFDFYLKKVKADKSVSSDIMARRALGCTPADIDSMIREAGLIALREKRDIIEMKDMSQAYDRITYGNKSNINMTDDDKKWTAYHEAGHAILAYLMHPKDDVVKATIIPRKGCLGFVSHKPKEESYSYNKEYYMAQIKICVASYAAEELTFGCTTSGVGGGRGSDFNTALTIARDMVWSYGMGKSGLIGDFRYLYDSRSHVSNKTKEILEEDVQEILQSCLNEAREILKDKQEILEHFAQALLRKGELEYDEIKSIFDKFNIKPLTRI